MRNYREYQKPNYLYAIPTLLSHLAHHTEEALIVALREKDKQVIGIIYDNYSPVLYGVILKIVKSEQVAEDVLQETFIKIWKNADAYDSSKGRLFTWLISIARNCAIDYTRSKDYKQQSQTASNFVFNEDLTETMETDYIGLKEIVEKLKPDNKEIIDLVYFQGYTQAEAAKKLSMPLGTVKTKIRVALQRLREIVAYSWM